MKKIFCVLICAALVLAAIGCEGFNLPDYNYSEDGKDEAKLFFAALNENFEGAVTWKFVWEGVEEDESFEFTMKVKEYGSDSKVYMRYINEKNDMDVAMINDLEDNYYIDNKAKTVSTEPGQIRAVFFDAMMTATLGKVDFEDESEYKWDFVSKKTVTIKDADGKDIETVEFEYNNASGSGTMLEGVTTLKLNFRKDFPTLVRMRYEGEEDGEARAINVYVIELSGKVNDSDFVPPGEAQGYTVLTEDSAEE
ncbi:MAG TPA: hypothetical protein GX745_03195 [Clostridiales bacterium]|nr:hypothetical protein [Clostridiales bacterium]